MSAQISFSVAAPAAQPVPVPKRREPVAIPQERVTVRPRFMGDSFVYVPQRVPVETPNGSPTPSPIESFLDWLFGKN